MSFVFLIVLFGEWSLRNRIEFDVATQDGIVKGLFEDADDLSNRRWSLSASLIIFSTAIVGKVLDIVVDMTCGDVLNIQLRSLK